MQKYILTLILVFATNFAIAWDGTNRAKVSKLDIAPGGDPRTVRVYLEGSLKLCGNDFTWAYIGENTAGYDAVVSALLAARVSQKPITIYANQNPDDHNYCYIGYVSF